MDPFQSFSSHFNPQLYESSNVPPSTDRLFTMSGYQAGLMTDSSVQQQAFNTNGLAQAPPIPTSANATTVPMIPAPTAPPMAAASASNDESSARYSGMYANTGFDMLAILSRVANR
jgi:hypothetical protein